MATAGVPLWSTTAATNATADPAVNWAEGMAPSAVNDSARAMMASVAKWRDDLSGITTTGSSTAYAVTTGATFASAADMSGMIFSMIPHTTSGASPTLSVDGLTARAINESTGVAMTAGALLAGTPYLVKYIHSSTEFILLGRTNIFTTIKATSNIIAAPGTTAGRPSAVAGGFRFNTDTGLPEFSDGASWFPLITTLAGAQTPYGAIINGTITATANSPVSNAIKFELKTLAGNTPSASDPVLIAFRNSTAGIGSYVYKTVTAAVSLTISSGSQLGVSTNNVAFKLWLVLFNDAGTVKLGVINCVSGTNIYPLGKLPVAQATAEGGAGAADSTQTFYTDVAILSDTPYAILGYISYESGLASAGAWAVVPTRIQLFGAGIPLPGTTIQTVTSSTTSNTSTNTGSYVATALTASISPTSAANLVDVRAFGSSGSNGSTDAAVIQLRRGTSTAFGPEIAFRNSNNVTGYASAAVEAWDAPGTTSSTLYTVYLKSSGTSNTAQFPQSTFGAYMTVQEVMT